MRSAASFDTTIVCACAACPSAAPMMRLSGTFGSSPCSIRRCFWMPLISIRIVPSPTGTGSASEPPCRTRSSSSVRSAARAARPTSSGRVFNSSSSSTTVSGTTTSLSPNEWTHAGSAISTDVSSTIRVRVGAAAPAPLLRAGPFGWRSVGPAAVPPGFLASRRAWSAWSRSVTATPHLHPSASPSGSWSEVPQRLVVVSHGRRSVVDGG